MPEEEKQEEKQEEKKEEQKPAANFVTSEDYKSFQETISGSINALQRTQEALLANITALSAARTEHKPTDVIDDDLSEELGAAGVAKLTRSIQKSFNAAIRPLQEKVDAIETTGLTAIGNLTKSTYTANKKHYKRFQREVDDYIEKLPAHLRLSPDMQDLAYNAVIGRHTEELVDETKEATIRSMRENPDLMPGSETGRDKKGKKVPTAKELYGDDTAHALRELGKGGKSEDEFARSLGYEGWSDYMEKTNEVTVQ